MLSDVLHCPILLDMEHDAAADPIRLHESNGYLVADPKDPTRPSSDQPLPFLVALIIVARQG